MRRLTLALFAGPYLALALLSGFSLGRGHGLAVGLAAFASVFGLALLGHGVVLVASASRAAREEIAGIRELAASLSERVDRLEAQLRDRPDERTARLESPARVASGSAERPGRPLDPPDARRAPSLDAVQEPVRAAVLEGRLGLALQPIVALPERRTVAFEARAQLQGADVLPGMADLRDAAREAGVAAALDRLMLRRCAAIAGKLRAGNPSILLFCSISNEALVDDMCLAQLNGLLASDRDLASALVLQIDEAQFEAERGSVRRNLELLAQLGLQVCIANLSRLPDPAEPRAASGAAFVKLEPALWRGRSADGGPDPAAFSSQARNLGAAIILDHIEIEADAELAGRLQVGYGQGALFGRPRNVSAAILAEADRAEPSVPA